MNDLKPGRPVTMEDFDEVRRLRALLRQVLDAGRPHPREDCVCLRCAAWLAVRKELAVTKIDVLTKVRTILADRCDDPADALIAEGEALVAVGKALKGMSLAEARAIVAAVAQMEGVP